jgi:hypothetical protein
MKYNLFYARARESKKWCEWGFSNSQIAIGLKIANVLDELEIEILQKRT